MKFYGADICADYRSPAETYFGVLYCGDDYTDPYSLPQRYPFASEWGASNFEKDDPLKNSYCFKSLEIAWLSVAEGIFYYLDLALTSATVRRTNQNEEEALPKLIIGLALGGKVALWYDYGNHSSLGFWGQAKKIDLPMSIFLPANPTITVEEYCKSTLRQYKIPSDFQSQGMRLEIDRVAKSMRQYSYRINLISDERCQDHWVGSNLSIDSPSIKLKLIDGTYDNRPESLTQSYKFRGKPCKTLVSFLVNKSLIEICLIFDEVNINKVFERFYGAHPETKTDFIVRMDVENKKYELALFRQGLKEPVVIPESAYQLIVFKNKFEDYRSANYSQPRGAWVW